MLLVSIARIFGVPKKTTGLVNETADVENSGRRGVDNRAGTLTVKLPYA